MRDKRGKRKNPDDMSELEKLRAEVKILRAAKNTKSISVRFWICMTEGLYPMLFGTVI